MVMEVLKIRVGVLEYLTIYFGLFFYDKQPNELSPY